MILSIKAKCTIISLVAVGIVSAVAGNNYYTLKKMTALAERAQISSLLMRQHMHGDMMHDAIRADVLKMTLGLKINDRKMIEEAQNDAAEHGKLFISDLEENLKLPLPDDIHKLFVDEQPALKSYAGAALAYAEAALEDQKNGTTHAHESFPKFEESFEALEGLQEGVSEKIEAYTEALKNEQVSMASAAARDSIIGALLAILVTAFIPIFTGRTAFAPLKRLISVMEPLSRGDWSASVEGIQREDEIGQMARAVDVFKTSGIEAERLRNEQAEAQKKQVARASTLEKTFDKFEKMISSIVSAISAAATELQSTAESMSATAGETATQSGFVATASEEATANVETVASAAEELSASIREIQARATEASDLSSAAADQAHKANGTVQSLSEASHKIGDVVQLISEIAEQTNLLALNATIEAARAGDAGKGFAVVASEVKALAGQTTKATNEISRHVNGIREAMNVSVSAIHGITDAIENVKKSSTAISAAVEEQGAATQAIAQNANEVAVGTKQVSGNVIKVNEAAARTGEAAGQVLSAANDLAMHGEALKQHFTQFLNEIRRA